MPATIEERVGYLEGKVEEHSHAWQDLRERITHMEQTFNQRFISIEQRITELDTRINQRIDNINQRIDNINQRITELDTRVNQRIDRLFFFILATLASSIGSLIAAIISIVAR